MAEGWLGKSTSDAWTGENAGTALQGFVQGALAKSQEGVDVTGWYATFLENSVLPNAKLFAFMVAYGELLVGLGLVFGLLTGIAAFFGALMNFSFLLAGTLKLKSDSIRLGDLACARLESGGLVWFGSLGTPQTRNAVEKRRKQLKLKRSYCV